MMCNISEGMPPITPNEAVEFYDKVILYVKQQKCNYDKKKKWIEIYLMQKVKRSL